MVPFGHYSRVVNNVCLFYSGGSPEYAVQLDYIVPFITSACPELVVSLCVTDPFLPLTRHAFPASGLPGRKTEFAYLKEFLVNPAEDHPVLKFAQESSLTFPPLAVADRRGVCLVCPDAAHPARHLSERQVEEITRMASGRGYKPVVVGSELHPRFPAEFRPTMGEKVSLVESSGWVVGAENEYVFLAAARGIRSTLISSTTDLYRLLFPHGETHGTI